MAIFEKSFILLMKLEFNKPSNFLHKNKGEDGYTVGGIYKTAHTNWYGWGIVSASVHRHDNDIKKASTELYNSQPFTRLVAVFYQENFWDKMKLDQINDQNTADEIFLFGVNSGKKNAIRKAQKIVGAEEDGIIGLQTITALNNFDAEIFSMKFDELEKQFYASIIAKKPSFSIFKEGWNNRAEYV